MGTCKYGYEEMTDQEQIGALKAQVNRFKRGVESFNKTRSMNDLLSAYIETPKQCLAEVKAKAIEEYKKEQAEAMRLDLATKIMMIS